MKNNNTYVITVLGNTCTWQFAFESPNDHLEEWNADGLKVVRSQVEKVEPSKPLTEQPSLVKMEFKKGGIATDQ